MNPPPFPSLLPARNYSLPLLSKLWCMNFMNSSQMGRKSLVSRFLKWRLICNVENYERYKFTNADKTKNRKMQISYGCDVIQTHPRYHQRLLHEKEGKLIKWNYFFISHLQRKEILKGGNWWRNSWVDDDLMLLIVWRFRPVRAHEKMIISSNKYRKVEICLRRHHHKWEKSFHPGMVCKSHWNDEKMQENFVTH